MRVNWFTAPFKTGTKPSCSKKVWKWKTTEISGEFPGHGVCPNFYSPLTFPFDQRSWICSPAKSEVCRLGCRPWLIRAGGSQTIFSPAEQLWWKGSTGVRQPNQHSQTSPSLGKVTLLKCWKHGEPRVWNFSIPIESHTRYHPMVHPLRQICKQLITAVHAASAYTWRAQRCRSPVSTGSPPLSREK
jgi:hypothetical protein